MTDSVIDDQLIVSSRLSSYIRKYYTDICGIAITVNTFFSSDGNVVIYLETMERPVLDGILNGDRTIDTCVWRIVGKSTDGWVRQNRTRLMAIYK